MIVEFIGPPGAGKSTISRLVVDDLRQSGHVAAAVLADGYHDRGGEPLTTRQRSSDRIVSLVTQPRLGLLAAGCLLREGRGPALSWASNIARRNRVAALARRDPGVRVLEEGPWSALLLARCAASRTWPVSSYVRGLHVPDLIVALSVPPAMALERIVERAGILADAEEGHILSLVSGYLAGLGELRASVGNSWQLYDTSTTSPSDVASQVSATICRLVVSADAYRRRR